MIARRFIQFACLLALTAVAARAGYGNPVAPPGEASSDLSVSVVSDSFWTGSQFELAFEVTVRNYGPAPAPDVWLEAVIDPASLDQIEQKLMVPPPGISCDAEALTCLLGDVRAAEMMTLGMLVHVPADRGPVGVGIEFRVSSTARDTEPRDNNFFSSQYVEGAKKGGSGPFGAVSVALLAWLRFRWLSERTVGGAQIGPTGD